MIRIVKPAAPAVLLGQGMEATREMCEAYELASDDFKSGAKDFNGFASAIYAAKDVKDTLLNAQHGKCAFCESFVRHISYGDVEHFRPKSGYRQRPTDELKRPGYYWLAYAWANLFFSCQLCNQQFKRNLFPLKDGRRRARSHTHDLSKEVPLIVDPSRLEPANFIEFREERAHAVGGCPEGETTIEVLGLNRSELMEARGRRLQTLKMLLLARDLLRERIATKPTPELTQRLRDVDKTLQASKEPAGEYSAMACAAL
jgi:uncharacterized protein (TIGR02646 family)